MFCPKIQTIDRHPKMRQLVKTALFSNPRLFSIAKKSEIALNLLFKNVHDSDYLFFANFRDIERGLFIDIGANCGQSAISFAAVNKNFEIVSFEPNKTLSLDLDFIGKLLGSRFKYHMQGIGKNSHVLEFHIPKRDNTYLTQEGTFIKQELLDSNDRIGDTFTIDKCYCEIVPLDDFHYLPSIIKLDVQGFELNAIEGMMETLRRCQPIMMIEHNNDRDAIGEILSSLGYELFWFDCNQNTLCKNQAQEQINYFAIPTSGECKNSAAKVAQELIGTG